MSNSDSKGLRIKENYKKIIKVLEDKILKTNSVGLGSTQLSILMLLNGLFPLKWEKSRKTAITLILR